MTLRMSLLLMRMMRTRMLMMMMMMGAPCWAPWGCKVLKGSVKPEPP